jgi:hypothetical protein
MKGRRFDQPPHTMEPGDYGHWSHGAEWTWFACTPTGLLANLRAHAISEHEDGSITVSPSIMVNRGQPDEWHGFLERGVWRTC